MTRWVQMGVVLWGSFFASLAYAFEPSAPAGTAVPEASTAAPPAPPPATPPVDARVRCVESHEAGQVQRLEGKLLEARALLETCASELCPALVREDCARWLAELRAEMPGPMEPSEPSQPGPVDPRAPPAPETTSDAPSPSDAPTPAASAPAPTHPVRVPAYRARAAPLLSYVLSGVAVVALGTGVGFGVDASDRESSARRGVNACAPTCSEGRVDVMQRSALIADIGFGVAIAAATGALIAYLAEDDSPTPGSSHAMAVIAW